MKMLGLLVICFCLWMITEGQSSEKDLLIGKGAMPNVVKDNNNTVYVVYGSGDSILLVSSKDGLSFTSPSLIDVLPGLFASATRGPQIAATVNGLTVTACTDKGNIFSYYKGVSGTWTKAKKVNDGNEDAKEALMALSGDGHNLYAVWLSVRQPIGQNVYGARSTDGGKTWGTNVLVYSSPDSTVCQCCKPSVAVKGNKVFVMFRNWLDGGRDMYLVTSTDEGISFGKAQKLGTGTWKVNGCPMDGGGLAIDQNGTPETVWRREGKIYAAAAGQPETEIGEGRGCSIETVNNEKLYAWSQNGNIIIRKQDGTKQHLGNGILPIIKALDSHHVVCVWENEYQIHSSLLEL